MAPPPRKKLKIDDAEGDMTAMIDCVFLLLIFFMLISEITQADLEQMQLPKAEMAAPDERPPRDRLVINIVKQEPNNERVRDGMVKIQGRSYGLGSTELIAKLVYEADPNGDNSDRDEKGISKRPLLIRCDRRVHYLYFQQILMLCASPNLNIKIRKIQIAIAKDTQ